MLLTKGKSMKNQLYRTLAAALATAITLSGAVSLAAALPGDVAHDVTDRPLQKINVAYSSISGNVSPLWVTQDRGFFRKYGLEVQAILIESGTTTAQALVAGDISFASVAGPAAIQSNLRGADVVIIAGVINTLTFQLYTERGITRINSKANP